jgi:integrase/recombinase XerD
MAAVRQGLNKDEEKALREEFLKDLHDKYDLDPLMTMPAVAGITAAVILDLRREMDSGYYPVKIRVRYDHKQHYYPCKELSVEEYSKLHGQVRGKTEVKTKNTITACFKRITDAIDALVLKGDFSLYNLARRLKGGTGDSILAAFDNKIANLEKEGKIGTAVSYRCAKNSIMKYTSRALTFADITPAWLKDYEAYLSKELKTTSISIYQRALRAIINKGIIGGIISESQYPFQIGNNDNYKIPKGKGRKIALLVEQIIQVFDYPILPNDEKWRDLWVFSFYCNGININDMLRLKYKDIEGDYIFWGRQKVKDTSDDPDITKAYINIEMRRIIKLWGNPYQKGNYIFPYLQQGLTPTDERKIIQNITHNVNKKMKRIGRALGYGDITTYWARHSFADISRRNGASTYEIMIMLSQKKETTTKIYLGDISTAEVKKNADLLPRRRI